MFGFMKLQRNIVFFSTFFHYIYRKKNALMMFAFAHAFVLSRRLLTLNQARNFCFANSNNHLLSPIRNPSALRATYRLCASWSNLHTAKQLNNRIQTRNSTCKSFIYPAWMRHFAFAESSQLYWTNVYTYLFGLGFIEKHFSETVCVCVCVVLILELN